MFQINAVTSEKEKKKKRKKWEISGEYTLKKALGLILRGPPVDTIDLLSFEISG